MLRRQSLDFRAHQGGGVSGFSLRHNNLDQLNPWLDLGHLPGLNCHEGETKINSGLEPWRVPQVWFHTPDMCNENT